MQSGQHTPGPWKYVLDEDANLFYVGTPAFVSDPGVVPVARIEPAPMKGHNEANARLISAAPELLEACQRGLDVAKSLNAIMALDGGPTDFAQQAIATISAAIAKATGKE